jgi:Zn-dependent protease with chaperone function
MDRDPLLLENNVSPEHPLAELGTLVLGIGLIGLCILAAAWLAVEGAVRWLPAALEQRAFPALSGGESPELASLLERLARHWPESRYSLRVGTVELDAPNAFALPGGQVLVTSALLEQAHSENELAFVLAHELGHVAGRDPLRALGRGLLVSLALAALGGAEGASVAGSAAALGERGFSREQESAADRFALALVAAEYGHVAGASDFLRRLPDAEADESAAAHAVGWLATHPRSSDRVSELEALARRSGWATEGALSPWPPGLQPRRAR